MLEIMITLRPNGVAVVQPAGRIDAHGALEFKNRINETIDSGYPWLVIDFVAVTFLDSTGLGVLITSLKRAMALGGDLHLARVPQTVRMMIELTSLQSHLPRYASVADALASYP
jgi:anti-sigma B factor antagonist